jgi:galactose mutarotase-like enzyme
MGALVRPARVGPYDALVLENEALRVMVVPELGGHVTELVDKAIDRNLLWANPRTAPRAAPYGANFDDWWSGGWDEIFPSGDQGRLRGETLPYMGELWCVPWTATSGSTSVEAWVRGTAFGTIAAARFERTLSIRADEPVVRAHYRLESLDVRPFPFTWGIHPAFAVTDQHRIDHPGRGMIVGVSSAPSMGVVGGAYEWPFLSSGPVADRRQDMRRARAREAAVFGGHWVTDLPEGWLSLVDEANGRGIRIEFDRSVFPTAWLWQVYGGWRGHHHVALEPWTSRPMDLPGAEEARSARTLAPGEVLETDVAFVIVGSTPDGSARVVAA